MHFFLLSLDHDCAGLVQFHCVQEKNLAKTEGRPEPALYGSEDTRPLSIDDFKSAHEQVRTPKLIPFRISSPRPFSAIYVLVCMQPRVLVN